jgi:sodium-coupled neutral amino acid transporter 10
MHHHEITSSHIPETRFKCLTIGIISVSLAVGLLIPNIELVLGLVGSTIGVLICVMFPAVAFICISTKSSQERLLAQVDIKMQ